MKDVWFPAQVAAAARDEAAASADVVYIDVDASLHNNLVWPARQCLSKSPMTRSGNGCRADGKVDTWLGAFFDRGGWCTTESRALRGLGIVTASDDCTAKRFEDARRLRLDDIAGVNRTVAKCKKSCGEAEQLRQEKLERLGGHQG